MIKAASDNKAPGADHAVREWGSVKPRLRKDLRFQYQDDQGAPVYVVEDLVSRKYHQLGLSEYRFLRSLDGSRTVAELVAQSAADSTRWALSEHEVSNFLRWLLDQQLLEAGDSAQSGRRAELAESQDAKKPSQILAKLLFVKIPLGNPDAFFGVCTRWLGWTLSVPALIIWAAVVGYGVFTAVGNAGQLYNAGAVAILPSNWVFLILVYAVLKVIHEIWHGVAAKRFGAVVPEWGIQLIAWVTPLTYVDATASWRVSSRWKRILVAFAGMYVELFIAAIAIHVWLHADSPWLQSFAANTVFAASMVTLLFNANPLMRFDGYYILSDASGIRNLAPRGQQLLKRLASRLFFGNKSPTPPGGGRQFTAVLIYGILAFLWRIVITIAILTIIAKLFHGLGLILAAIFVIGGVVAMIAAFFKMLGRQRHRRGAVLIRCGIWAVLIGLVLWLPEVNPAPSAVAVVRYENAEILRADCPGFVDRTHCTHGARVAAGDLLLTLENAEERARLEKIQLDLRRSELRSQGYLAEKRRAAYEAEQEVVASLRDRLEAQTERVESLKVVAPSDGVVHAPGLGSMTGRYQETGQQLLTLYPNEAPTLLVTADQGDLDSFGEGDPIRLRLRGRQDELAATLTEVEKRATTVIPHPALVATAGGPLIVVNNGVGRPEQAGVAGQSVEEQERLQFGGQELARPRVTAAAEFTEAEVGRLGEGEWGMVRLGRGQPQSLGSWLGSAILRYLRAQFESGAGASGL